MLSIGLSANALFIGFLALSFIKLPHLTADYLDAHARDEDTPAYGIFLIVLIVVVASVVSLLVALNGGENPDPWEVGIGASAVLLGWFTVQALGAYHYAYEYYQVPQEGSPKIQKSKAASTFPGDERPDGTAFMYFSYRSVHRSPPRTPRSTSNAMRRRVGCISVFCHLYNTIILAAAVNVVLSLGGG